MNFWHISPNILMHCYGKPTKCWQQNENLTKACLRRDVSVMCLDRYEWHYLNINQTNLIIETRNLRWGRLLYLLKWGKNALRSTTTSSTETFSAAQIRHRLKMIMVYGHYGYANHDPLWWQKSRYTIIT